MLRMIIALFTMIYTLEYGFNQIKILNQLDFIR